MAGVDPTVWTVVATGVRLTQMICFADQIIDHPSLLALHQAAPLVFDPAGHPCEESLMLMAGLLGADLDRQDVGFVAVRAPEPVNLVSGQLHDWQRYFAPLPRNDEGYLFLERDRFTFWSLANV